MKFLRVILIGLLVLIMVGIIAAGIFIRYTSRKALPDYDENISLSGLASNVEVIRDEMAVPHIYAENETDLYRSIGYVQAQDRLWQMDLLRRLTLGRLSEILGSDLAGADQLFRSLHFSQKSRMVIDSCDEHIVSLIEAYSEGVNSYIEDNISHLPPEFTILGYIPDRWEPVHSANLIGYMAWGLTMAWSTEVNLFNISQVVDREHFIELLPDMDMQDVYVIPGYENADMLAVHSELEKITEKISNLGLQVFHASNNWTVSKDKSMNGHAMLANDMHLDLNAPGIWYQMHQVVPGNLDVTGVVLPGQPFVVCGHNENVAWGFTNVMVDDMDFYLETLKEDDSLKYMVNGEYRDMKVEREEIITREGDTLVRYNRFTHRGPVISGFKGIENKTLSMRWTGNEYSNELRSVYLFNRMTNWDDFKEAASTFISISQNMAYADAEGNIGMYVAAGVPLREGDGIFIVPGDTTQYDWKGMVPFAELPHVYNPENGFIASANNRSARDNYPYYISRWYDLPNRIERIMEGLSLKEKISMEDMERIQSNQNSKWAEKLVPFFKELVYSHLDEFDEMEKDAANKLFNWDYGMDPDGIESTIFEQLYFEFIRNIFEDEMGEELFRDYIKQDMLASYYIDKIRSTGESVWFDKIHTDVKENASDIAFISFRDAIASLSDRLGDDLNRWEWGKVHSLTLKHPLGSVDVLEKAFKLNRGPYPVGGSYHTVSPFSYSFEDLFYANHGSSHRHIFIAGDWDSSKVILPTGISGIPASPFYCDQTPKYLVYEYKTDAFSRPVVEETSVFHMEFTVPEE